MPSFAAQAGSRRATCRHGLIINVSGQTHYGPGTRAIGPARQDRPIWPPLAVHEEEDARLEHLQQFL